MIKTYIEYLKNPWSPNALKIVALAIVREMLRKIQKKKSTSVLNNVQYSQHFCKIFINPVTHKIFIIFLLFYNPTCQ